MPLVNQGLVKTEILIKINTLLFKSQNCPKLRYPTWTAFTINFRKILFSVVMKLKVMRTEKILS